MKCGFRGGTPQTPRSDPSGFVKGFTTPVEREEEDEEEEEEEEEEASLSCSPPGPVVGGGSDALVKRAKSSGCLRWLKSVVSWCLRRIASISLYLWCGERREGGERRKELGMRIEGMHRERVCVCVCVCM